MTTSLSADTVTSVNLNPGHSGLEVQKLAQPNNFSLPFVFEGKAGSEFYIPMGSGRIATILKMFETVKFLSLTFHVVISGVNGFLRFAASPVGTVLKTELDWLGATVGQFFTGNAQGRTSSEYSFPTEHPFGVELKAATLGNPRPSFMFKFTGDPTDVVFLRGRMDISCGGYGIMPPAVLKEISPSVNRAPPTANSGVLRQAQTSAAPDDDSDDEDE